jgi:Mce-associated membrane protein
VANTTIRGRGTAAGSPGRRSVAAAARAAAKRTERVRPDEDESGQPSAEQHVGTAVHTESDTDAGADTPAPGPQAPDTAEPRARRRGRLSAVLALLAVAGLVAAAVLGWEYREGRQADAARVQALAAAQKAAPVVLSYDYRRLDQDFAAARGHLTGTFREEYRRTTTSVVAPTAKKYHGVVKATVVEPPGGGAAAASVVSASPDRAVVLLFVNQVTKSTQVSGSRVDLNRVRMTLTRTSAGWKVSAVDAL